VGCFRTKLAFQGTGRFVIRLEKGEDILGSIRRLAEASKIQAGVLEGIGSLSKAKLGHYDFTTKKYHYEVFQEELEILSLAGNISSLEDKPLPHVHVTLGKKDFTLLGGHLDEGSSANMVELFIRVLPGKIVKSKDVDSGLNLFQLSVRI
jgi:uncharacterized protein